MSDLARIAPREPLRGRSPEAATVSIDLVDLRDTPADADASASLAESLHNGTAMLSVVIALLNEEENLDDLYARLKAVLCHMAPVHEILFVDDGSRDQSHCRLMRIWRSDPTVTVIRFRRNFGKAAALSAGFDRVRGDVVAMIDADLQDQPEELPKLVAKLDEGYDLVTGWKKNRKDPLSKRVPSRVFNRTVSAYFKIRIHDFNCGLKVMRGDVARSLRLYGEMHRFIPVMAATSGFTVGECEVVHKPRLHGASKYGARRLLTGGYDFLASILLTRFYQKPLHFFGTLGLMMLLAGTALGGYTVIQMMLGVSHHVLGALSSILLVAGVQVICTGLIGEMVAHASYHNTPRYVLSELHRARSTTQDEVVGV
ncbi:MAG: glycosyltransferase family 2 protein [Armatimonadetes bacterium]|nr:glycosyltransferase family 2 protein [Armatimonadota bacterium]MDE2206895.1 glycosyltransferase family 2 protein [Armatimonadota bacterium]